jgi:uncharacterized protein YuzE
VDKQQITKPLAVQYDPEQDILYLLLTDQAQEAIAEEVGDEVFVRFDPITRDVVDVEFLNFRSRLEEIFGPEMKYLGSEEPERVVLPLGNKQ